MKVMHSTILNCKTALHNYWYCLPLIGYSSQEYIQGQCRLVCGWRCAGFTRRNNTLAMSMFAIGVLPLIHDLQSDEIKQVWYADDTTCGGTISAVKEWWDRLSSLGPSLTMVTILTQLSHGLLWSTLPRMKLRQFLRALEYTLLHTAGGSWVLQYRLIKLFKGACWCNSYGADGMTWWLF